MLEYLNESQTIQSLEAPKQRKQVKEERHRARRGRVMPSHIDQEVLTEILKRLPVKLLVRYRCVSKTWYSLISSPCFISIHTNFTLENKKGAKLLLRHYTWTQRKEKYTVHSDDDDDDDGKGRLFSECQEIGFPFKSYSQYFEIVGSCNGLLCLSDTYRINLHTIILWNPTIRNSVTLPMPSIALDHVYMFVLGFGFDSKASDYKVVRIVYGIEDYGRKVVAAPKVELYELRKDAWKIISVSATPHHVVSELSLQVFLHGAVHWIGYNPSEADNDFRDLGVVLFNMSGEEFGELKLPDSVAGLSVLDLSIGVSSQLLSLTQYNHHKNCQWVRYHSCCIWVMKEYGVTESWTKRFTVDLDGGVGKALGLKLNGDIIMVASNGDLVICDLQDQQVTRAGIKGIVQSFYLDTYIETLILLKGNIKLLGHPSTCGATSNKGEFQEDRTENARAGRQRTED